MGLESYEGLYGHYGYKDERGNLYIPISRCLLLIRKDNKNGTYNAILIDVCPNEGLSVYLSKNMSLKQWRKLYIESRTGQGIERLEKLLEKAERKKEIQAWLN